MKIRLLFAATAVAAGLCIASSVHADEPPAKPKPSFGFSMLKATTPEEAKAKTETWLKSNSQYDKAAFEKIWADDKRTVLDRTADSLALGNSEAVALLANVRKLDAAAPTEVPAILKDDKQDPFFRANVALAFAKAAANKKVYEEALDALKSVNPDHVVDPASYFFFKAVAEHATMKKEAAVGSIVKLLDDVSDSPARYTMIATLMFFDMQHWPTDPKSLSNIEKLMDNSGRRLDLARGGEKTQDIQKKIVFRLDELIRSMEDPGDGPHPPWSNPGPPGPGDEPGPGSKKGPGNIKPSQPAPDTGVMGGDGRGIIDPQTLKKYGEQWGTMPPEKRARVVAEITRDLPPRFESFIKGYFEALDKVHGYKK